MAKTTRGNFEDLLCNFPRNFFSEIRCCMQLFSSLAYNYFRVLHTRLYDNEWRNFQDSTNHKRCEKARLTDSQKSDITHLSIKHLTEKLRENCSESDIVYF